MKPITTMGVAPVGCIRPDLGQLLAAYEWGLLASEEEDAYERHLVGCPACAGELHSTAQMGGALRHRPAQRRRLWLPIGAAAAAAAVLMFSQLLGSTGSRLAETSFPTDTVAAPAQQATMTFELRIPSQTQFSYELQVPGAS